ncbi:hypothetical protein A3850_007080 [Lewinella sp. 4G2]|nr:hypothetical protein A3850_007080 [Lewinella sp. 4G2]
MQLRERLEDSDVLAIGQVVESEPFFNNYGEIYTKHTLAVDRISVDREEPREVIDTLFFFTMGGRINEEQLIVYPSLRGIGDAEGLFMLRRYVGDRVDGSEMLQPVAVHESLLPYDRRIGMFLDGTDTIGGMDDLVQVLGLDVPMTQVSKRSFRAQTATEKMMNPSITGISPRNVSAGIGDVITLTGTNFGATRGAVFFDSPDDGPGGSFTGAGSDDIISWSNTSIRVRVVSEAGSGQVIVRTAAGAQSGASPTIDVDFAVTNLRISNGSVVTPLLIDDMADGDGGYTFAVNNSTANGGRSLEDDGPARAALERAIRTWQVAGDFSVYLEGTTSVQLPAREDGVNIVSYGSDAYDFDRELGSGTVGIAFSYYSACGSSEFETIGADVLFRRPGNPNGFGGSVNYNFGPGQGFGTDFESVALHEFGHVHQLKHVADPAEVMSFRTTNGTTQREISPDTRAGAQFVADLALQYNPPVINCGGDFPEERDYVSFSAVNGNSLPLTWNYFGADAGAKNVSLTWGTSDEVNADYHLVERSADGTNFQPIGEVTPTGSATESADYLFYDEEPLPGDNYYRITQVDVDGSAHRSPVRQISFGGEQLSISVYPNPVVSQLNVRNAATTDGGRLRIYNAAGREVRSIATVESQAVHSIDVADLAAGQYVLRDAAGQTIRFVR